MTKQYTVAYTYSLWYDIRHAWHTWRDRKWLEKHDQAYTMPSIRMIMRLLHTQPRGVEIACDRPVTCYWVSSGTWGAYETPDRIYICPWYIDKAGGIHRVIQHELLHLQHAHTRGQFDTHEAQEAFIESVEQKADMKKEV